MDEVEMRLGYRFELMRGEFSVSAERNGPFHFELDVYNHGWASPYNPRRFEVLLRNQLTDQVYYVLMPEDPRFWLGGDTVTITTTLGIPEEIPAGYYELLVHFPDPSELLYGRPEYSIRLANEGVWESATGFNSLFHVVEITSELSEEPYGGALVFREWSKDVVSVEEVVEVLPERTYLIGNYPNPFNSSTTIQYELSRRGHVRLTVYNLLGQRVAELVDSVREAGRHAVVFDASGLPSGTYLYRLHADDTVESRSMVMIK